MLFTLFVQSLGRVPVSSIQSGFRFKLRESHGLLDEMRTVDKDNIQRITHMKLVVLTECWMSKSSQSGRQLHFDLVLNDTRWAILTFTWKALALRS